MSSIIKTISKEELQQIINTSDSITDVLKQLNYNVKGGSFGVLKRRILADNIDMSHFHSKCGRKSKYTLQEALVEKSSINRANLKNLIIREKLIEYKCYICGLLPIWNNKTLILILEHKNGINNDARIENLRFLCPNCNSQTTTFSGRNCRRK